MDPLRVEGVQPEALNEAIYKTLTAMREYFSGSLFGLRPAVYKKNWKTPSIEVPGWNFGVDSAGVRMASLVPVSGPKLALEDFERVKGKIIPKSISVSGRGYSISIKMDQLKADYK